MCKPWGMLQCVHHAPLLVDELFRVFFLLCCPLQHSMAILSLLVNRQFHRGCMTFHSCTPMISSPNTLLEPLTLHLRQSPLGGSPLAEVERLYRIHGTPNKV